MHVAPLEAFRTSDEELMMRIGLDLDNTLIRYDELFLQMARERRLIADGFLGTKRDVRDHIRRLPDGELEWQRLQAQVYGPGISGACPTDGALDFIRRARQRGLELVIVSHKSMFSNLGASDVNLRDAALGWLRTSGMIGPDAVPAASVYFESTRTEKIARIVELHCTHFVDDLEEVFNDPAFPADVERLLFAAAASVPHGSYRTYGSFREIAHALIPD